MKIFWSWQDDYFPNRNRHFIKAALEDAVATLGDEYDLEDAGRPELDHDTKGVAGAVEIAPTVLKKIAESVVFVGDVTPIARSEKGKALPNPNVMVELGWSLNAPGQTRQIYVLNTADGWKIEDLPFDIRGRRVLTYSLAEGVKTAEKVKIKTRLVSDLTEAIRTNLKDHLETAAAATTVPGVVANPDDPSIWAAAGSRLSHHDMMSKGGTREVHVAPGGRGYIRIIPASWKNGPPSVATVSQYPFESAVSPVAEGTSGGNFGAAPEGFLRYWVTSDEDEDGVLESANFAMYFDDTGEFWVTHGTAIGIAPDHKGLRIAALLEGWSTSLRRAMWFFDRFEASSARRVEVGVTGLTGVVWPGQWQFDRKVSRKPAFRLEATQREWTSEAQADFLGDAYRRLTDVFGRAQPTLNQAKAEVAKWDPERSRPNPFT